MRVCWPGLTMLPLLLALACDEGTAGDPTAVDAAPVGDPCAAPADITSESAGEPARLSGVLEVDHLRIDCGPGVDRADTVLRFVPPTTGSWLIEAQSGAGDALSVSLREQCAVPTSQRACADGLLTVELVAATAVFVVVEATDQVSPVDFSVSIRPTPPPQLTSARVHVNPTYDTVGVEVVGEALARPVQTVELTLLDVDGAPVDPILLPFDRVHADAGAFDGVAGVHVVGAEFIAGARVRVFDTDQTASAAIDVGIEAPGSASGDTCDPRRAVDVCAEGQLCTPTGCRVAATACPAEWAVRGLEGDGPWVHEGNTSGAPPHGRASCGGGTNSAVYRFEAPQGGQYLFDVNSIGHPDPLLFLRSTCALNDIAAELGCNDDAAPGDLEHSRVVVALEAEQTVFVFVDGYAEEQSAGGAYRLSVSQVTPPIIDAGEAFVNRAANAVGVRLAGVDPDDDLAYAWMLLLDADGEIIEAVGDGAFNLGFTQLQQAEGRYTASTAVAFLEPLDALGDLAMVAVQVTDDAGLYSDVAVLDVAPALALAPGAECDTFAAFGSCPGEQLCARLGPVDAPAYCAALEPSCPAAWPVVDLHAEPDWRHVGDTTGAPNHGDLATCSGGGSDAVYRFVAPRTDRFVFAVVDAQPGADSVLFARSQCAFSQPAYELACNDDRSPEDYLSTVEIDLEVGEAAYLFVGAYGAGNLGPFTLQAR